MTTQHGETQPAPTPMQEPEAGVSRRGFLAGAAATGVAVTLAAGPTRRAFGDAFTDPVDHGSGPSTDGYTAEDVIYSMCMQCNTFCTIKVRLTGSGGTEATSLVRKIAGNPYSPLNSQPHDPIPYATPLAAAVTGLGDMARESRSQSGGKICLKGQSGPQIVHDSKRITAPLKRVGPRGSGKWKTITWEQALAEVLDGAPDLGTPGLRSWWAFAPKKPVMADWEKVKAKTMTRAAFAAAWGDKLIDVDHPDLGPKSNLLAVMGGDREALIGERMTKLGLGSINVFNHGGVCGVNGVIGNIQSHPTSVQKRMYADLDHCRYLIVWGTEPLTGNKGPTWLTPRISNALADGMKLVVIDPRLSTTAQKAHRWVPVKPGADGALAFGIARWIVDNKRYDERYLRAAGPAGAAAVGEPTWSDATHLVKVKDPKRGKLTMVDLGLAAPPAEPADGTPAPPAERVVLVGGKPVGAATTTSQADLDVETTVSTPKGPVLVKSVFRLLRERLAERTVQAYADEAGVDATTVTEIAQEFTSHGKRAVVMSYRGAAMHANGFDAIRAINVLNFLIGNHDWKGGHIAAGAKYSPLQGRYDLTAVPKPNKAWGIPITREKAAYQKSSLFTKGEPAKRRWYPFGGNLVHEVLPSAAVRYPYGLKALFIHRHSPVNSSPGGQRLATILQDQKAVELVVSFDVTVGDTSAHADYVLPDLTYLERFTQESIYPNQPYRVTQLGQPTTRAFPGPRPVEAFYIDLLTAMGLPGVGKNAFPGGGSLQRPEDYWIKLAANVAYASKQPVPDADAEELRIFTAARRKALGATFEEATWQQAVTAQEWKKVVYVLNRGGRFEPAGHEYEGEWIRYRYGGECDFYAEKVAAAKDSITGKPFDGLPRASVPSGADGTPLTSDLPLQMINWKARAQGTHRTVNAAWLREVRPSNYLWINGKDAKARGIVTGDRVRVRSSSAQAETIALVVEGIRPGVVGADFSYGQQGYAARPIEIDGKVVEPVGRYGHTAWRWTPMHEETGYAGGRGEGFSVNTLLPEETSVTGGGGHTDPIGGGAAQLDNWVEVTKV
ncbi:MAG: molybdopterin-dependent oxidoreductase [Dermatophilaceae bacterium]